MVDGQWKVIPPNQRNAKSYLDKTLYQLIRWISLSLLNYGDLYNHAKWFARTCLYSDKHSSIWNVVWDFPLLPSQTCNRLQSYMPTDHQVSIPPSICDPKVITAGYSYGGFLKWWHPINHGILWVFLLKMIILGCFWGYHHLRKHPYGTHNCSKIFHDLFERNVSQKKSGTTFSPKKK